MGRATTTLAAVLSGVLVTACGAVPVTVDAVEEAGIRSVAGPLAAPEDEPAPRPQRSGTMPERSELELVPGPAGATEVRTVTADGDVRQPPRSTSVVREAGAGPETSVEVEVGEVIASYAGETTGEGTRLTLDEPILFDFDSAQLRPSASGALEEIAAVLAFYADAPVEVFGHTDGRGSDAYNDALSQDRADAVAEALIGFGVDAGRVTSSGVGSREPVADEQRPDGSDDPDGRAANRRVELLLVGVDPS